MTDLTVDSDEATELRNKVVDQLRADGTIVSAEVEAAMRKVARHRFAPDAPLEPGRPCGSGGSFVRTGRQQGSPPRPGR